MMRFVLVSLGVAALSLTFACPAVDDDPGEGEGEGEGEGLPGEGSERSFLCEGDNDITVPSTCAADDDCTSVQVLLDCCGTKRLTGVNVEERSAFEDEYEICVDAQPICDCAPSTTSADDGSLDGEDRGLPDARCVRGVCSTTFADEGVKSLPCGFEEPIFVDASCTDDAQCTFGNVQTNCCGSLRVTGMNVDAAAGFEEGVGRCNAAFGECACATDATIADDGSVSPDLATDPAVACVDGLCVAAF